MNNKFATVTQAPADPILGLNDLFKKDSNPNKLNLGVGVYMDDNGNVPIFKAVKQAEKHVLETQTTKSYVSTLGDPNFIEQTNKLIYGDNFDADHIVTAQMPAGTGALRIGFEFVKNCLDINSVYLPNITWANHHGILEATGLNAKQYTYYNAQDNSLDFTAMLTELGKIKEPAIIVLHAICHNPTGVDLDQSQWQKLADLFTENNNLLPFLDCAYQGFARSLDDDIYAVRLLQQRKLNFILAYSFSKNMGLYRDRIGALSIYSTDASKTSAITSQIQITARRCYSSPPAHGAEVISKILNSQELNSLWRSELDAAKQRILNLRQLIANKIPQFSFVTNQNGMFSMLGLDKEQIMQLRTDHGIYIVGNSRINIAGLNPNNIDYFCNAIQAVK